MKYSKKSVDNTKFFIESEQAKEKYKLHQNDFSRKRKMNFVNTVYYNLNKKGLTSKMEIEEFQNIINMTDISSVAVLKQREKLNSNIYNEIRDINVKTFYNEYKNDVKTFKGYILLAVDGSRFEIPNTPINRNNYDSAKNNTSVARALVSNYFDILNHYVLNTVIGKETASEKELDKQGFENVKKLNLPFPTIRIKDRGYVYLKDFYYSNLNNEKYVIRLKSTDYKEELKTMKSDDEVIEIKFNRYRLYHYRDNDPEFYNTIKDQESIFIRIVKIELSSGETEYLATNLTKEEVSTKEMKELYNYRWQIEINYHLLKESLKIETITSSKEELIKQDIFSQMLAFNLFQSFVEDAQREFNNKGLKYKYEMKINKNMAIGFFKKSLIIILLEENKDKRNMMLDAMSEKMQKYIVPVRKNRTYPRTKTKDKNKHPITKRKSF